MTGSRNEGRGKREDTGRQREEWFVTEGSGERGGRSGGGGETEDQGRSGGTGGREKRLVCSHDMTDVLPGTVQACMHNTNTNTHTRSQPVLALLVYPAPSWPGTNKHRPRDGGREMREAGSVRSVVGTEGRGNGEGGRVGEGAETSGQGRGRMTGRRETRERRTWRAGTEGRWEMGKRKWGDDSKEERGKRGPKRTGGGLRRGKGTAPPPPCVCFKR